jgi:hypothetical protein
MKYINPTGPHIRPERHDRLRPTPRQARWKPRAMRKSVFPQKVSSPWPVATCGDFLPNESVRVNRFLQIGNKLLVGGSWGFGDWKAAHACICGTAVPAGTRSQVEGDKRIDIETMAAPNIHKWNG